MKIRKATPADLATVQELNKALFEHDGGWTSHLNSDWPYEEEGTSYLRKMIAGDGGICFIAEENGNVVGCLTGLLKKAESFRPILKTELDTMFVEQDARRAGIGKALVAEFFKWSREQGAQVSCVGAASANERAIAFYEAMGFLPSMLWLELNLQKDKVSA